MTTYESLLKQWDSWCKEQGRDPIKDPLVDILNFLAEPFKEGYEHRSLNSANSSIYKKVNGV